MVKIQAPVIQAENWPLRGPSDHTKLATTCYNLRKWNHFAELLLIQKMIVYKRQKILIHMVLCLDPWFHPVPVV